MYFRAVLEASLFESALLVCTRTSFNWTKGMIWKLSQANTNGNYKLVLSSQSAILAVKAAAVLSKRESLLVYIHSVKG